MCNRIIKMAKNMMFTFIILFSLTWNYISGEYNNGNDNPSATFGTNLDHRDFNTNNSKYEESQRYSNSLKNEVSINGTRGDNQIYANNTIERDLSNRDWCHQNRLKYCKGSNCGYYFCENCPEESCPGRVPQLKDINYEFLFIQISVLIMIIVLCILFISNENRKRRRRQRQIRYSHLLREQNQDQRGENNDFRSAVSGCSHCTVDLNSGLNHERDLPPSYYECRNQSIDGSTIKPDQHCSSRYTDLQTDRNQSIISSSSNGNQQQALNDDYSCVTVDGWESPPSYDEYLSSFRTANS